MKLYSRPLSPYSSLVRAVAYYKDVPLKILAPPAGFPIPDEFREVSPFGRVPVLITGSGETILESAVIAEYLEERFPEPRLLPEDPRDRAIVRMFTRIAELEVLTPTMQLFELVSSPHRDEKRISDLFAKLERGLAVLESRMVAGPFALGEHATFADAWLTPIRFIFNNFRHLTGRSDLLDPYPKFGSFESIALQHPVFSRVWYEMADGLEVFLANWKSEE
ncbi:MAG: glutathione S-transferase family protein [Phyllobacterium sp.]